MPISIKNEATEALARQVAQLTGESLTEAIQVALQERYGRLQRGKQRLLLAEELNEIAGRCARRPLVSRMSADEILGYDESGVPTR